MYCVLKCKILIAMRQKQNLLKTCWKIICRDFPICSYYDYNNKFSLAVRCLSKREEKKKKKLNLIKIYHQENLGTKLSYGMSSYFRKNGKYSLILAPFCSDTIRRNLECSFVSQTCIFTRTDIKLDTNRTKNTHSHNI